MAESRLILLSQVRLLDRTGVDITPRNRKMRGLLAYLACTPGHQAERDRIADLLWSDRGEPQARASLRQSLVDLKATAPAAAHLLAADRTQILLQSERLAIDLLELEEAMAAGDIGALAARLAEVGNQILGGLDGLSPALDDWLRQERARFEERLTARALALADAAAAEDAAAARLVVSAISRLFEAQEAAVQIAMRLDHAAGDMAGVHRRFRQLERVLRDEYGTAPSGSTRALLAELVAAPPATAAPAGDGGGSDTPILVVLPFAVLDGDTASEALVRVLGHDLEAALCRLPDLRVLSLSQPTPERLARVGGRAIASYALSGSVRPGSEGLRFTFRLAEVDSGRVVWSSQVAADPSRMGEAIDLAVEKVVGATLPAVERDIIHSRRLEQAAPAAYALYLKGRTGVLTARNFAEAKAAAELLEQALGIDPSFVNPRHHLAGYYNNDFMHRIAGHDIGPWRQRALALATEAVQMEPFNSEAMSRLAWCHMRRGDWNSAATLMDRALAAGPNHAETVQRCGHGLCLMGELPRARTLIQQAFVLNPFPRSDYFADLGLALALDGDHAAAVEQLAFAADPSIYYLMIQTAAAGNAEMGPLALKLAGQLRQAVRQIWVGPQMADDRAVLIAFNQYLPMRYERHRRLLIDGLTRAGISADQHSASA